MSAIEKCAEMLRSEAESMKACHTLDGDWRGDPAEADYHEMIAVADAAIAERDELRAKIEAMERQEPVGVLHVGSYYGEELEDWEFEANQCACDKLNEAYVHNPTSLPLYALPGAKGEEK
jgi:hypothetical protein